MIIKKTVLLFAALITSLFMSAQVTIQMEREGGVYKLPCNVNGVKMKFIFDTGASTVCMSQTMAQFLLDGDYLSLSDIKGSGKSVVADGSIVNHAVIVLRDIEIAGLYLHNIQATVIEGQNAPLLLGQTAISELGRITIEGNKLIIHTADNELSDEQIDQLGEQARKYIKAKSYSAAIESLEKIDEVVGLSEYGLCELCFCYYQNSQCDLCIQVCNRWIAEFENDDKNGNKEMIYGYLADSYYFGIKDSAKALLWYQKQLSLLNDKESIMNNKKMQAYCYQDLGQPYRAKDLYIEYLNFKEKQLGYFDNLESYKKILDGLIKNEDLGSDYYGYALILYDTHENRTADNYVVYASQLGYHLAKKHCNEHGFRYKYKVQWNW